MLDILINFVFLKITKDLDKSEEEKEIIFFGITRILEDIPKAFLIFVAGVLLNLIYKILIVTVIILLYKTFVGGMHLKTNITCFIYSLGFYLITIYSAFLINYLNINICILEISNYIFSIYIILKYAPADVENIPKFNLKLRRTLKIKSFISLNLIYIFILFLKFNFITDILKIIVISSIFYINLATTKTFYEIFNVKYGFLNKRKEVDYEKDIYKSC